MDEAAKKKRRCAAPPEPPMSTVACDIPGAILPTLVAWWMRSPLVSTRVPRFAFRNPCNPRQLTLRFDEFPWPEGVVAPPTTIVVREFDHLRRKITIEGFTNEVLAFSCKGVATPTLPISPIPQGSGAPAPAAQRAMPVSVRASQYLPWDLMALCRVTADASLAPKPFASMEDFVAAAAQLVATGICDPKSHWKDCRATYALLAEAQISGASMASCAELDVVRTFCDPATLALSSPPIAQGGKVEVYGFDKARKTFYKFSDGREEFSEGTSPAEYATLMRALVSATHRNALKARECFVFAVPAAYGTVRESLGCSLCKRPCAQSRPSFLLGGAALLTAADLRIATRHVAARRFDLMARTGAAKAPGTAALALILPSPRDGRWRSVDQTVAEEAARYRDEEIFANLKNPDAIESDVSARGFRLAATLKNADKALRSTFGFDAVSVFADPRLARAAPVLTEAFGEKFVGLRSDPSSGGGGNGGGGGRARRVALPGIEILEANGWNLFAIRPYVPPCVGKLLDACFKDRHPTYDERKFLASFVGQFKELANDGEKFKLVWKSVFQHPEPTCTALFGDPDAKFESSEYGKSGFKDLFRMVNKDDFAGCGCAMAVQHGMCPFVGVGDVEDEIELRNSVRDADRGRRGLAPGAPVNEEIVGATFDNNMEEVMRGAGAGKTFIAKTRCMNYLCAACGLNGDGRLRTVMISRPTYFYEVALSKKDATK